MVAGTACLATTTLILLFRPQAAVAGNFTLIVALLALSPLLFDGIVAVFKRVQRHFHAASTVLALEELQDPRTRVRSLAVAATGAIAVFGSVAIAGAQHNLQNGLDRTRQQWNRVTEPMGFGVRSRQHAGRRPVLSVGRVDAGRGYRRSESVSIYRGSFLNVGDRRASG